MTDIRIFCLQKIAFFIPWKIIIVTTDGKAVIPRTYDLVFIVDDTGAYLCAGIFASFAESNATPIKYSSQEI